VEKKEVLTVVDLAQELEVGLAVAYALVRQGTIPSRRIGRKYVISRRQYERWLHGESLSAEDASYVPAHAD
jgi:excisionase family DNA binding protein